METIIESDHAIIKVNKTLKNILSEYLNKDKDNVDIRFDLPEIDSTPSKPTVSVFLYDIHEDLQLRSAEPRHYNPATSSLLPGWVNINCNYLITYWHSNKPSADSSGPDSLPDNQAAKVITLILNALINNRQLTGMPRAYTKVVPPQENLNSLGNFWQALGNRPRLSLLYSITVPVKLQNNKDNVKPVSQISAYVDQKSNLDNLKISQALADKLCADLGGTEDVCLALAKVNLTTQFTMENNEDLENKNVILEVSGITRSDYLSKIKDILSTWKNSQDAVVNINGISIFIAKENSAELIVM
ncbi:DUF4255 domain-containing protein [Photorhabdus tasmaniensis]